LHLLLAKTQDLPRWARRSSGARRPRRGRRGRPSRCGATALKRPALASDAIGPHLDDDDGISVGIVAFSKAQSDMVTEILERVRRTDPVLEAMLRADKRENVFVKNIVSSSDDYDVGKAELDT
jgi:hypothetical protein